MCVCVSEECKGNGRKKHVTQTKVGFACVCELQAYTHTNIQIQTHKHTHTHAQCLCPQTLIAEMSSCVSIRNAAASIETLFFAPRLALRFRHAWISFSIACILPQASSVAGHAL